MFDVPSQHVLYKKAYKVEGLSFGYSAVSDCYTCRYSNKIDSLTLSSLDFILKALNMGQGKILFLDSDTMCYGIDELKTQYLMFRLAGI